VWRRLYGLESDSGEHRTAPQDRIRARQPDTRARPAPQEREKSRGEGVWLLPASRWAEYKLPPQLLQRGINHQQDWIRACKGGAPGVSDFAVSTRYVEWLALGTIALRVPGKLLWDANRRRFSNSEEANRHLKPFLRKGWDLKV
jgi:hypothetical protein